MPNLINAFGVKKILIGVALLITVLLISLNIGGKEKVNTKEKNIVERYIKEMEGQAMDKYAVLIKYAEKFEKMKEEGLMDDMEHEKLMQEASRIFSLQHLA